MSKPTAIRGKHGSQALAARHARALARAHPRSTIRVIRRDASGRFSTRGKHFDFTIQMPAMKRKPGVKRRIKPSVKPPAITVPTKREYSVTPDYKKHRKRHGGTLQIQVHMTVKSAEKPTQEQLEETFKNWLQGGERAGVNARIVSWQHGGCAAIEAKNPEEAREIFAGIDLHVGKITERK